ncbi:MAG: DUF433 domain-containing protein, partial [Terracidiphilus sp.]
SRPGVASSSGSISIVSICSTFARRVDFPTPVGPNTIIREFDTPVIRGTRIPVYDVASLVDAGTPLEELREIYPKLTPSQIELASMYAKANPQRGRPRRRRLPKGLSVSISKKRLRSSSLGG